MARKLDQILVIDLESTCWKDEPPEGEQSEIIEIGICILDLESLERRDRLSILVKPENSRVSPFCTELTTLTQEQVDEGFTFKAACKILEKKLRSRERLWASYGDYDRRQFESQCQATGVRYPFGPTHLNVKNLFALMQGMPRELELREALEYLDIPMEGTHHRGFDDAWNIGAVLAIVLSVKRADERG